MASFILAVEGGVHAADIDQETHHGHVDGSRALRQQLVFENLAAFAALRHGVKVDVSKRVAARRVGLLGEDGLVVLKDKLEEVELDVFAPQRNAIVLFEVLDLVPAVDRRHAPVGIAAGRRRRGRVVGTRRVGVVDGPGGVVGIAAGLAFVGDGRVPLVGRGLGVVHLGVGGQDVAQAVARVGLFGARLVWLRRAGRGSRLSSRGSWRGRGRGRGRRRRRRRVGHDEGAIRGLALGCNAQRDGIGPCRVLFLLDMLSLWLASRPRMGTSCGETSSDDGSNSIASLGRRRGMAAEQPHCTPKLWRAKTLPPFHCTPSHRDRPPRPRPHFCPMALSPASRDRPGCATTRLIFPSTDRHLTTFPPCTMYTPQYN